MTLRPRGRGPRHNDDSVDYVISSPPFFVCAFMSDALSRILLRLTLITQILRFAFASQAAFAVNETIQVPVSLGLTSRDLDALHVQLVFDEVLEEVSDKVNMSFGYVKECVYLQYAVSHVNLTRKYNAASGLMMNSMGCGVLQTGSIVREIHSNYVCTNMLHKTSGGNSLCAKTKKERMKSDVSGLPKNVL